MDVQALKINVTQIKLLGLIGWPNF